MARVRLRRTVIVALLFTAVLAGCAIPLVAASGRTWPRPVRVYNPTGWQRSVAGAIGAWNRTGAHVHFVFVARAEDADVIVVASDRALADACPPDYDCTAYASRIGYRHGARTARIFLPDAPDTERGDDAITTTTIAHELGHILGLRHRRGCSIMNAVPLASGCHAKKLFPSLDTYLCGPLPADVDDAVALYGGRRASGYRPACRESRPGSVLGT